MAPVLSYNSLDRRANYSMWRKFQVTKTWDFLTGVFNRALGTLEGAGIQRCSWAGNIREVSHKVSRPQPLEHSNSCGGEEKDLKEQNRFPVTADYQGPNRSSRPIGQNQNRERQWRLELRTKVEVITTVLWQDLS